MGDTLNNFPGTVDAFSKRPILVSEQVQRHIPSIEFDRCLVFVHAI